MHGASKGILRWNGKSMVEHQYQLGQWQIDRCNALLLFRRGTDYHGQLLALRRERQRGRVVNKKIPGEEFLAREEKQKKRKIGCTTYFAKER